MVNIFVISSDKKLIKKLADDDKLSGYKFVASENGKSPSDEKADIILVDLGEVDHLPVETENIPMVGVAEAAPVDNILIEVDDIILEPIDTKELDLRLKRQLLLMEKTDGKSRLKIDEMIIDFENYEVSIDGKTTELTFKEYELLKYLASNPGRVFDRQTLLNQIWEYDYFGGTRTVDVHIRRLRAKLGTKYGAMIQTVRQVGYRFSK